MARGLRESGIVDQLVHCHGWDMKSTVCLGSLSESRYELATGDGCTQSLYRAVSDYAVGSSKLVLELEQVRPVLVSEHRRDAWTGTHRIQAGQYHSTLVTAGPTVSVVATSRVHSGRSRVVGPRVADGTISNDRRAVEDADRLLSTYDDIYLDVANGADRWASFVFLVDENHQVLVARSTRRPDLWQPIGGRSERLDRDPVATAIREAEEEVGIRLDPGELVQLDVVNRDVGEGMVHFWVAHVRSGLILHVTRAEILDFEWTQVSALADLPTYPGTRSVLQRLRRHLERGANMDGRKGRS